ncbi:ATPase [Macleaya cordata]|uniref:ATPase n=1 Tax=Macleaya cordata TaxID=56857 RepID=A0A200PWX4_MACCD|nr:ATPase [Macleaya cordata]
MESFIPLGGFFPTPSNLKGLLGSTYQSSSRCHLCNEKFGKEVSAILTGGCTVSLTDQYQTSLPLWLQSAELSTNNGLDLAKVKDDRTVLSTKVTLLQKKWNDICRRLHHNFPASKGDVDRVGSQAFPCIMGFPSVSDRKDRVDNHRITTTNASSNDSGCKNVSVELQKISPQGLGLTIPVVSKIKNDSPSHKQHTRPSKGELSPPCSLSVVLDGHGSPSSAASVTTDLGLGTLYSSSGRDPKKPTCQANKEHLEDSTGCFPTEADLVNENFPNPQVQSSSCSGPDLSGQFDPRDFKMLWKSLKQKVGRQDEAIYAVSRTVACCRAGKERRRGASLKGDIWFSFLGPDRVAKKKLAIALAEMIFGSRESLICVDLASPDGIPQPNTIFDSEEMNGYDLNFRGKTVVDYIVAEIRKKPLSVVFLENVDKADMLVQNCLFQAIRTGKFIDSHGREIGINNAIFAVTSRVIKGNETFTSRKEPAKFSEEKILEVQGWQMQILSRYNPECTTISNKSNVLVSSRNSTSTPAFLNKRKLIETLDMAKRVHKTSNKYLDLNLPIEDLEATQANFETSESGGSLSENSVAWLENFFNLVDESVVFEPFDFDILADEVLKKINETYRNIIGFEGLLEIDSQVMEQVLAAAWLSNSRRSLDNWVEQVLVSSFTEARERYNVRAGTVLKLVTCEGLPVQDQAPGVCLPARIILR